MKVTPLDCHQRVIENTLVSDVDILSADKTGVRFDFKDKNLGFFYDHEIDHIPGMVQVCALRQAALAVGHIAYAVPHSYAVFLDFLKIKFLRYAYLTSLLTAEIGLVKSIRKPNRISLELDGTIWQNGLPVLNMSGQLTAMSEALNKRVRSL